MSPILSALFFMITFNFNMSFYIFRLFYQKCFQCKSLILSQMFLFFFFLFFYFFIIFYFLNSFLYSKCFPFPGSPLPICPISLLLSTHSPITSFLALCPGTPLECWIKPFQDQGPLLTSSWELFVILMVFWVFRASGLINIHLLVIAFHVYSFVIGLPHLG